MKKTYKDNPIGELAEYHTDLVLKASDKVLGKRTEKFVKSLTGKEQDLLLAWLLFESIPKYNKMISNKKKK